MRISIQDLITTLQAKKERFLSHPLIEAYLKLKWFATWRIYVFFLLLHVAYLLSIIGFAYVQFSGDHYISNPMTREGSTVLQMKCQLISHHSSVITYLYNMMKTCGSNYVS